MGIEALSYAVGLQVAVRLQMLKARLGDTAAQRAAENDFDGYPPIAGRAIECCPCCGVMMAPGVLH